MMGLIEDAKALAGGPAVTYWDQEYTGRVNEYGVQESGTVLMCAHCKRKIHDHAPTCPWLAMPRIVRALAAAQQVVRDGCCRQACCNDQRHDDCSHNVLREAMRAAP